MQIDPNDAALTLGLLECSNPRILKCLNIAMGVNQQQHAAPPGAAPQLAQGLILLISSL